MWLTWLFLPDLQTVSNECARERVLKHSSTVAVTVEMHW